MDVWRWPLALLHAVELHQLISRIQLANSTSLLSCHRQPKAKHEINNVKIFYSFKRPPPLASNQLEAISATECTCYQCCVFYRTRCGSSYKVKWTVRYKCCLLKSLLSH